MKKTYWGGIPEAEAKPIDFLIKKLIGEAIPESEPKPIDSLIKTLIGGRFLSLSPHILIFQ